MPDTSNPTTETQRAMSAAVPVPAQLQHCSSLRKAVIKRAADGGSRQAMINLLASVAPTKRDPLIQMYIERLQKAGWKPGMARGGRVNPYAKVP